MGYKDLINYTYISGVNEPSRNEEDLTITEEDVKGFVQRRKAAAEKQKKAGMFSLAQGILEEQYSPRISLDYGEVLPILPGAYRQDTKAIKDKLIAEQLDIAQQIEDYKAALSDRPAPNLGIMSPRELVNTFKKADFTPLKPQGMGTGPIASPPDKPTDIANLPKFSLTGPAEFGPTAGGILRALGPAQFTNPLTKPKDALGSGFGFILKGMKGLTGEEYLTKSIVANIQKNSDTTGKNILRDALEEKGVRIKDRTIKQKDTAQEELNKTLGVSEEVKEIEVTLPEFDTNLPDNTKVIKEALKKNTEPNFPILRVKDLMMSEELRGLEIKQTQKSPFSADNVSTYFSKYPETGGWQSAGYTRGLPAFRVAFSEEGVGLKAKGVTPPYGLSKTYKHPQVVGGEGTAPLYGHVRSLELKELEPGTIHPFTGQNLAATFGKSSTFPLAKLPGNYSLIQDLEEAGMLDPSKKVKLEKIIRNGVDMYNYDESVAKFNNYNINPNSPTDDLVGDFLVQFPRNVENPDSILPSLKGFLTFKRRMQKINAMLQLVPIPNISLQGKVKTGNFSSLLRGGITNNRMTIDDVLRLIKAEDKEVKELFPEIVEAKDSRRIMLIEDAIRNFVDVALQNSFNAVDTINIKKNMFLPGVIKDESKAPNISVNSGVGEFLQGQFRGRAGEAITLNDLIKYVQTLARIDAQTLILTRKGLTNTYNLQDIPGVTMRPKLRINEKGNIEAVRETLTEAQIKDMGEIESAREAHKSAQKGEVIDIEAESIGLLTSLASILPDKKISRLASLGEQTSVQSPADVKAKLKPITVMDQIRDLIEWEKLGGPKLYQLYKASNVNYPSSQLAINFPAKLREQLKSLELNWGKGKRVKRLGEEQFDTFKTSQFRDPETMLENMRMQQRGDAILTPEQQMERFERAYNLDDEREMLSAFAYANTTADKAFANLQNYPDKLVEISTLHNVKQALKDGFDKLQFNTFATMAELAGWSNGVFSASEVYGRAAMKEYLTSPFKDKISASDNFLFKVVTKDFPELAKEKGKNLSVSLFDSISEVNKNVQERNAFMNFWNTYNNKFNLDELVENFIKDDITNRNGQATQYIVDNFGSKHSVKDYGTGNLSYSKYNKFSDTQELLDLFSKEKSKEIYKQFRSSPHTFLTKKDKDINYLNALADAATRVNVINRFKPKLGFSPFANYKERKNNPFYLKYGMPSDKKLEELIAKMPTVNADGSIKEKNLGFSLQYGKYKIKALEGLGLKPKIIRPDEDNPFTFIEVNLGNTKAEKAELLKKLEQQEIALYSQYMPVPNFNEVRDDEEMGAT